MLFDVFYERKRVTLWGISTKEPSFYPQTETLTAH